MHTHDLSGWSHGHVFDRGNPGAERGTRLVLWITLVTMFVELGAGWWFNSLALLADGWHMGSHALALGLSVFAYGTARRYEHDPRFAFGTWKVEVLAGFASALALIGVALVMAVSAVQRLLAPAPIAYREALLVAIVGLAVNLVCARILAATAAHGDGHVHEHGHGHGAAHGESVASMADPNLAAAYFHVLADALTSLAAIVALTGGWLYGWAWLDPLMAIVGAGVIALWAKGLVVESASILLDREMDHPVVEEVRTAIETGLAAGATRVIDLHVWRVGRRTYAGAITVVTHDRALTPERVREVLATQAAIVHATIEIQQCPATEET